MADNVDVIVLFPRYTPLVGGGGPVTISLVTSLLDIRVYERVRLTGWMGTGLGVVPATVRFVLQQSTDLTSWVESAPLVPSAGAETDWSEDLYFPWMRVEATFESAVDPGVTFWLVGQFVRREATGGGPRP